MRASPLSPTPPQASRPTRSRKPKSLTLLGPSGSGKTTTLMLLAGFEAPTTGRILLDGTPLDATPAYRRGIGVVFQHYALFPHMSVAENLAFPLQMRRLPRAAITAAIAEALAMVRLDNVATKRPAQLSGGQQQRVALARALIFRPKLLLMDEPLGALDKQLREHMQTEIRDLHRRLGLTILYVTHDQAEAMAMSDRIAVFRDGAIEQIATPGAIYDHPATAFVAGFIGENNALHGIVIAIDGTTCTVAIEGGPELPATTPSPIALGTAAILCIRPESITTGTGPATAELLETRTNGDHTKWRLRLASQELWVKQPRTPDPPPAGTQISLGWPAQAALAFPAVPR